MLHVKTVTRHGNECFVFYGIDERTDEVYELGSATLDDDGVGYYGRYDTQAISFVTIDQMINLLSDRSAHDDIEVYGNGCLVACLYR